jgi:hypothetical protein
MKFEGARAHHLVGQFFFCSYSGVFWVSGGCKKNLPTPLKIVTIKINFSVQRTPSNRSTTSYASTISSMTSMETVQDESVISSSLDDLDLPTTSHDLQDENRYLGTKT